MDDYISRQAAINLVRDVCDAIMSGCESWYDPETGDEVYKDIREVDAILKCNKEVRIALRNMLSAQPDRLTDDDFETIRIHLNAYKEKLCNQRRWKEAEEYQQIIDRFMAFASTQPERKKGKWIYNSPVTMKCDQCGLVIKDCRDCTINVYPSQTKMVEYGVDKGEEE